VLRLNVAPTLARTLRSTNAIESMISICRTHASNVKNWRDGQMALRWCAAGMVEAGKQFRRVNGHRHLRSCATRSSASPDLSVPPAILTLPPQPDDHRAATEVPRVPGVRPATEGGHADGDVT
jgi:putative transposase